MSSPHLHGGTGRGQLYPNEEGSQNVPLPAQVRYFIDTIQVNYQFLFLVNINQRISVNQFLVKIRFIIFGVFIVLL